MRTSLFAALIFALTSFACNLPISSSQSGATPPPIHIPTFTPTVASNVETTPPTPTPAVSSAQTRSLNPRAILGCDIFLDSDFPNTLGSLPNNKQDLSDGEKKACQYSFANASLFASISTSLPGREAYETVRQFDAVSGGSVVPYAIGEAAVFKVFSDNRLTLEAVLNGWYVVLDATGFDEKNLVLLAELLLSNLIPYSS